MLKYIIYIPVSEAASVYLEMAYTMLNDTTDYLHITNELNESSIDEGVHKYSMYALVECI